TVLEGTFPRLCTLTITANGWPASVLAAWPMSVPNYYVQGKQGNHSEKASNNYRARHRRALALLPDSRGSVHAYSADNAAHVDRGISIGRADACRSSTRQGFRSALCAG